MKLVSCTCCGSDVTVPYFHNDKPYGYTCITKVTGKKARKSKEIWLQGEPSEVFGQAILNGMKLNGMLNTRPNGLVRMTTREGFPVWKDAVMLKAGLVRNLSKHDSSLKLKTWRL